MREPTDDFTPIEIAFLCWCRMHAISPENEDVELGNRLIAQAALVALMAEEKKLLEGG